MKAMGNVVNGSTHYTMGMNKIRSLLPEALKEWAGLVDRTDVAYLAREAPKGMLESATSDALKYDQLKRWIHEFEEEQKEIEGNTANGKKTAELLPGSVALMACSWCRLPSAALKKCGGCGEER